MYINEVTIRNFFKFLDADADYFTVAFMDADSKNVIPGYGVRFEKVDTILKILTELMLAGLAPTLHVTLNGCNEKGRKVENVIKTRVLCVDLDVVKTRDELKEIIKEYHVHAAVESSPGKYHLYWACDNIPFETWKKFQLALAYKLGGDLYMDNLAKMIRVPGVSRSCKDKKAFEPDTIWCEEQDALR